mmetsp:Transcript_10004/g.11478  ORF Transcript_10004/g.11478 Transcript_10004/m.11478 type:complete len:400 (-) Transcript_10004:311-1510(-)
MTDDALGFLHQGDYHFVDGEYTEAITAYDQGVNLLATDVEDLSHIRFRLLSHRSESYLNVCALKAGKEAAASALKDAKAAHDLLSKFEKLKIRILPNEQECCRKRLDRASVLSTEQSHSTETTINSKDEKNSSKETKSVVVTKTALRPNKAPTMPKYQYYQNDKFLTIALLECNVQPESLDVQFLPKKLVVIMAKGGKKFTVICGRLFDFVVVDKCKIKYMDEKVLIKLRKKEEGTHWHELFGTAKEDDDEDDKVEQKKTTVSAEVVKAASGGSNEDQDSASKKPIPTVSSEKARPYSSHRDWDAIERNLEKDEKKEKPQGEDALNHLFKDIYGKADGDTRRAMIKSFQTSGGTVLSTNWDEVAKKDYEKERQAPKGMQWKQWDGKELPQKDHDDIGKD